MGGIGLQALGLARAPEFVRVLGGIERVLSGRLAFHAPSPSGMFSNIYAFGDSLSDDGNTYLATAGAEPVSPPYDKDFSNGPVWVDDLATSLGAPVPGPSLAGGTDFAVGGAETGSEPLHTATAGDLPSQSAAFEQQNPTPNPNALYTVWAGSNDVLQAIGAFSANPRQAVADVLTAANNEAAFVRELAADGAKNVLVANVPDLGKTPEVANQGPAAAAVGSGLAALFDIELDEALAAVERQTHINLHVVDTYALIDQAIADPSRFGLTNVTTPVWSGSYTDPNSGTLVSSNPAVQDQYLFWDSLHPTETGQTAVAGAARAALFG
jgi:phospholipase/lecithinase/hemolysin